MFEQFKVIKKKYLTIKPKKKYRHGSMVVIMKFLSIMKCGDNEPGSKLKVQQKKYKKSGAEQKRTSTKIRGRIRYHRGVSILCLQVTRHVLFVVFGKQKKSIGK